MHGFAQLAESLRIGIHQSKTVNLASIGFLGKALLSDILQL